MIHATTMNKLYNMRLSAMADAFKRQLSDEKYQELSFEERVGILVDVEWAKRRSNKLLHLIKKAGFRYPQASIEDIEYHADRKRDKAQILRLSGCAYIQEKRNLIIMGASKKREILCCPCFWYGGLSQLLYRSVYPTTGSSG